MVTERDIILIGGKPGSGKTNLSRRLQNALDNPHDNPRRSVEHISFGDYARQQLTLGRGAIESAYRTSIIDHLHSPDAHKPLDAAIAQGMILERLAHSEADVVLLDGYPRYIQQVDSAFELAVRTRFYIRGVILTYVHEQEAVRRIMKRQEGRDISEADAHARLTQHNQSFPEVESKLKTLLPSRSIDTYYPKERTLVEAYLFAAALIGDTLGGQKAG